MKATKTTHLFHQIRQAANNLNPEEVRSTAHRPVRIGIVADSDASFAAIRDALTGNEAGPRRHEIEQTVMRASGAPDENFDLLLVDEHSGGSAQGFLYSPYDPVGGARRVLEDADQWGLALARLFPPFRKAVAERVIVTVSRENALFSIATALPNVVPSLVSMPWAVGELASDTAFLTANQIRMAFLLAAASGRDVGYREQKAEIASIFAGAFGWRAIARELSGKIPFGAGLIPKAAVAFAGTYVVGLSLERYYRMGRAFTTAERKAAYKEAYERGKSVASSMVSELRERPATT
jgi:hypothetical protein